MCKFQVFCGCCPLIGAAITGFVLSIIKSVFVFLGLLIDLFILCALIAIGESDVLIYITIILNIVENIIIISGTICLGIAVIKDEMSKLVGVWLFVFLVVLLTWTILVILKLVRALTQEAITHETKNTSNETTVDVPSPWIAAIFDIVVYCIIMPFLLYVWIGVLNYYWLLESREKSGKREKREE